jgi:acyl carrier protein
MNEQEILSTFTRLLRDLLGDDSIVLTMTSSRADVPSWDSFQYVTFIAAVEMQLGVKFRVADVESFATVGDIVRQTQKLLAQ